MNKRPYVGVAVIIVRDRKVLLGKRKSGHGSGSWQFPGGHLEFKEDIKTCAIREVLEEAGICIKNIRIGTYTNDIFESENMHYVTLFVIAEYDTGEAEAREPDKCEQWGWFEPNCLPEPLFLPVQNLLKSHPDLERILF